MKTEIERRNPDGPLDYLSLAVTTFGVGYLPLMPGTFGSMVGVAIYIAVSALSTSIALASAPFSQAVQPFLSSHPSYMIPETAFAWVHVGILASFLLFTLLGVWASGRATALLGNLDPSEAVVDEVIGQLITFLFVPFGIGWPLMIAGFLLFRLFDIWKPYPIDSLQVLPGGIGVCADDILAGVYAGVCLSVIYAISLSI